VADREIVLDVAHNPAAVAKLREFLLLTGCKGRKIALFSAMADKDLKGMLDAAAGYFDAWFLADQPANPRAAGAAQLAALLRANGQRVMAVGEDLPRTCHRAWEALDPGDQLVAFGSFFTVAAALPLLERTR
jgi:dihydrofolate synthase/folylpolyglutamate synthase